MTVQPSLTREIKFLIGRHGLFVFCWHQVAAEQTKYQAWFQKKIIKNYFIFSEVLRQKQDDKNKLIFLIIPHCVVVGYYMYVK